MAGLILFVFATMEVLFALFVYIWSRMVRLEQREVASVQRANVAMASMIAVNAHGILLGVCTEVVRIFGYQSYEIVGHSVNVLLAEKDHVEYEARIKEYLDSRDPRVLGKVWSFVGKKKDGVLFPVELVVSPQYGEGGALSFLNVHVRDVTAKQWAELQGLK